MENHIEVDKTDVFQGFGDEAWVLYTRTFKPA